MTEHNDDPFPDTEADDNGAAVAVPEDGTLEVFPPHQQPTNAARAMLAEHVAMLNDAWRIADVVCQTPAAPARYRAKPKEGTVAIMYGAELGLPPMASLQKIINVNGMPGLEARTMKGLLKTKGFKFRTIAKTADRCEIHAWEPDSDKRTDPPDETAVWTIDRARQAKFCPTEDPDNPGEYLKRTKSNGEATVIGNMKYIEQPMEMLEAKATAEVCRAIAPEILMGLPYAAEERDEIETEADEAAAATPARRAGGKGVDRLRERAAEAAGRKAGESFAEAVDADVVDDPNPEMGGTALDIESYLETAPAPAPDDATTAATASPEPAPAPTPEETGSGFEQKSEAPTSENTETGEKIPETIPAAEPELDTSAEAIGRHDRPGDLKMSAENRAKGVKLLGDLLTEAEISFEDMAAVVAEIAAKRPEAEYRQLADPRDVTNADLKYVVDQLRHHKKPGNLYAYAGEALNAASLREAGLTE